MGRKSFGINATSGSASLSSAVYFLCRHMLYGHCHLPIHFSTLAAQNKQILHRRASARRARPTAIGVLVTRSPERPHPQSPCSQGITCDPVSAPR